MVGYPPVRRVSNFLPGAIICFFSSLLDRLFPIICKISKIPKNE